jgi:hypothetical protein
MGSVNVILGNTERTNSSVGKFPVDFKISDTIFGNSTIPTLLAQKISFPTDSVSQAYTDNSNMGGLIGGYYTKQRESYNSIQIDFLETNEDIIDYMLRPWVIAVAHKGLIEDGETFIKTNLVANMYTRYDEDNWAIRKRVVFEGVAPIGVTGDTLNYESTDNAAIVHPCTFTYKSYYIQGGRPPGGTGGVPPGGAGGKLPTAHFIIKN